MKTVITAITGMSLKAKIVSGVMAVFLIGGGTTTAVIIHNIYTNNENKNITIDNNQNERPEDINKEVVEGKQNSEESNTEQTAEKK